MATRKLNALELSIHQTAISSPDKTLTQKELVALAPDVAARTEALNFLLGTGLLKALTRANGVVSAYRAVMKREIEVKKDMSGEEAMVLSHIQTAGNKGIWTKHLKAKTELHQTVIDRCLKSLLQKQLVKVVKSVEHRTRKMYMLAHLEPAVELTGGPWYTDNELDTEFIKNLSAAILLYIKDRSFPKQKRTDDQSPHAFSLYPISSAPPHPTAQQIQTFLSKSKITETKLTIEHVEMLLNILVLDGEIERIPAFGASLWESGINRFDESDEEENSGKKRKYKGQDHHKLKRRKRSKDSGSEDDHPRKSKKRRRAEVTDTTESEERHRKPRKKKHKMEDSDNEPSSSRRQEKKSKRVLSDDDSSCSTESSSDSETEDDDKRGRHSKKVSRKRSPSPSFNIENLPGMNGTMTGASVYRAIRQERVALGWSQVPCGRCPVFDFCKDKGPVNPTECTYYEEWLGSGDLAAEEC